MREPRDDSEASLEEVGRLLLRAGKVGAPPGASQRAFAVAAAMVDASLPGSARTGGKPSVGAAGRAAARLMQPGWLGVFALTGAVAVLSAAGLAARHRSALGAGDGAPKTGLNAPPPAIQTMVAPPTPSLMTAPEPSAPAPPALPRATVSLTPSHKAAALAFELELELLDEARSALDAGQAARALALLRTYSASRFPHGVMRPESSVLRIEALVKAGDRAAAERAASDFAATYPESPYTARIRSLLDDENP